MQQLQELRDALESDMREQELRKLVDKVHAHYEYYYTCNDSAAKQNILQMLSPSWRTSLEKAFMWIGGWRPTMFSQLAYALAGHHVEAELAELLEGTDSPSMASLTGSQLESIDTLQRGALKDEERLSEKLAVLQQSMADEPLISLVQAEVNGLIRHGFGDGDGDGEVLMHEVVNEKLKVLENIFLDVNFLRVNALVGMLNILTTFQSAQYLMAMGQLQAAFRKMGGYDTVGKNQSASTS
ncbi:hypothetical protein O6H91_12G038400 [Diphasiastrum complanatum]|nr:hypothetical protein O6H91_12G038400 [Diphasiastrum complanatum]